MKYSLRVQIPVFILIRMVLNATVRMVYPFLPIFGRGLGVDLWMLSRAVTLRSATGIIGPFLATVSDSRGRKAGMVFGLLLFTFGICSIIFWTSFPGFILMLVFTLLGNLAFLPSMQAYLGDHVPYRRRGFVIALTEISWSLSFILVVPLIGYLIARGGWKAPFPFLAGAGALAICILAWMLPSEREDRGTRPALWHNLRSVFTYPPALAGITIGLAASAANEMVNLIFGVWLEDSFGVQIATLAAASLIIGISELSGEVLVSGLTDRVGKRLAVGSGLVFNSLIVLFLPSLGQSLTGALVGLFLFYLTFEFSLVSSIPLMTEIRPAARATMMAAFISGTAVGRTVGDLLAPGLYQLDLGLEALPDIFGIVIGVIVFNMIALFALRLLILPVEIPDVGA